MDKIIKDFTLDLSDLPENGEKRFFNITGDSGAEFSLEVKDNATGYYYNFNTNVFQAARASLERSIEPFTYSGNITFPSIVTRDTVNGAVASGVKVVMDTVVANTMAVGDRVTGNAALDVATVTVVALNPDTDNTSEFSLSEAIAISDGETLSFAGSDQYDIYLYAKPGTKHANYNEVRFGDGSLDLNSSTGSGSLLLQKVIYQYADVRLSLAPFAPSSSFSFTASNDDFNISRGKSKSKTSFSLSATAATDKCFQIIKQPTATDILSYVSLTVGSAPESIYGENTSSDTVFYQWPVDDISNVTSGMNLLPGTNVTANSNIAPYVDSTIINQGLDNEETIINKSVDAITTKSQKPTITKGLVTTQPGNIVFNNQQALALASDTIKIGGYGPEKILSMSGYDLRFTNLKVALTTVTTTTTAASTSNTNVILAARSGIFNGVSTVSGIGIDASSAVPTVSSGGNEDDAGTVVLSAAQTLESGITLTFGEASKIATITGEVEIIKAGTGDLTLNFDVERLLGSN